MAGAGEGRWSTPTLVKLVSDKMRAECSCQPRACHARSWLGRDRKGVAESAVIPASWDGTACRSALRFCQWRWHARKEDVQAAKPAGGQAGSPPAGLTSTAAHLELLLGGRQEGAIGVVHQVQGQAGAWPAIACSSSLAQPRCAPAGVGASAASMATAGARCTGLPCPLSHCLAGCSADTLRHRRLESVAAGARLPR